MTSRDLHPIPLPAPEVPLLNQNQFRHFEVFLSMLQDALARRATEVDALNGGIARFGRETGVATPLNDAIAALIRGMERSWDWPSGAQAQVVS